VKHSSSPLPASATHPLRILHALTHSKVAGAEINMARLCRGLLDAGHEVLVVVRPGSPLCELLRRLDIPYRRVPLGGKVNLLALARLARVLRQWRPDVLNTHNSTASQWGGLAGRLTGVPVVSHVQGIHYTCTLWTCYGASQRLIACSDAVRRHTIGAGLPANRVRRVYNAVDPDAFEPEGSRDVVRAALGLQVGELAVGTFAHLSEKKGHADLLMAVAKIAGTAPQFKLFCVGDGPLREELPRLAADLGIEHRVRFLGYRTDIPDVMHAMDLMVLPSHREPFGIVYVEAMLAALPVIACNAGGAPEVIVDGETGRLVPPRNPEALAAALEKLLRAAPVQRAAMGEAGRRRALEFFTLDRMVDETVAVYRECLDPIRPVRERAGS